MQHTITITLPASYEHAAMVRMLAAHMAHLSNMDVEEVEDMRMAAAEGFIYSCATGIKDCTIHMTTDESALKMIFELGDKIPEECVDVESCSLEYTKLLMASLCSEYYIDEPTSTLVLSKCSVRCQ